MNTKLKFSKSIKNSILFRRIRRHYYYLRYQLTAFKYRLNPELFLKKLFFKKIGFELNLISPKSFNEKIQWLKLNWADERTSICADKYLVRSYIKNLGYDHLLNDLIFVGDRFSDIQVQSLPDQFVVKATHGSGMNIICKDLKKLNWNFAKIDMNYYLKIKYDQVSGESVYKSIKPRIIIEKYLENKNGSLDDIKLFCFDGLVKVVLICIDRLNKDGVKMNFYDLDWNIMPFKWLHPNSDNIIEKPYLLDEMISVAQDLSKPFPFVRVDFYECDGKLFFGEMTFTPGSGLQKIEPQSFDDYLGSLLNLPD